MYACCWLHDGNNIIIEDFLAQWRETLGMHVSEGIKMKTSAEQQSFYMKYVGVGVGTTDTDRRPKLLFVSF